PAALFGIGRSLYWERRYQEAFIFFDRVARSYPLTKDGREGLNFSASSMLRLGRASDAVDRYREYIDKYPTGERFEQAHLNVIDSLREAARPADALQWMAPARQKFSGSITEADAILWNLRLNNAEGYWQQAVANADELSNKIFFKGVIASRPEVT